MTLPGTGLNVSWGGKWTDMVLEFGDSQLGFEDQYDTNLFDLDDYS